MHPIEFLLDLFAASGCLWIALYLFANFSVKKFIVKRYTQETNLSETKFFAEHAQFVKYLPDNLSAGFYATHLVIFAWAWNIVRFIKVKRPNVTYFDDIPNPEFVMQHFSKKEIANAKRVIVSGAIFLSISFRALFYLRHSLLLRKVCFRRIAVNAGGKLMGGEIYDFGNDRIRKIYHSPEESLWAN